MSFTDVNLSHAALILLDIEADYLEAGGQLRRIGVEPTGEEERRVLLGNIQNLLREARKAGRPVVYVRTAFRSDMRDCFFPPKWQELLGTSPILVNSNPGSSIPEEIAPQDVDFVITKKGLCAFQFTHLDRLLSSLGVDTCILTGFCGLAGSIDETCRTATLLGYDAVIASDPVFPVGTPHLETLTNQAAIKTTEELISFMNPAGRWEKVKQAIKPAMIIVAMNNDGNHPLGSKYRYSILSHGPAITEEQTRFLYSQQQPNYRSDEPKRLSCDSLSDCSSPG